MTTATEISTNEIVYQMDSILDEFVEIQPPHRLKELTERFRKLNNILRSRGLDYNDIELHQ